MDTTAISGSKNFWILFAIILMRYVVLATVAFLLFYVFKKRQWLYKKIQQHFPSSSDYLREILYSITTSVVFTGIGLLVFASPFERLTQAYYKISDYGIAYFIISILVMILVHDTYFYWTHRWMHRKSVFRMIHKVHHLSTNPSPWAAFAFHPIEAVIEGGVIVLIAVLFPVHPLAVGIFLLFMMAYNVYGHLGYELYPKGFSSTGLGRWVNTSINHNLHHQRVAGNFGLYFLWWDRWMGTLQTDYETYFDDVQSRPAGH
jgi:sterol desaturase/sphingolipid hydroxylase (fatty acid hydroxylase superfamily)